MITDDRIMSFYTLFELQPITKCVFLVKTCTLAIRTTAAFIIIKKLKIKIILFKLEDFKKCISSDVISILHLFYSSVNKNLMNYITVRK